MAGAVKHARIETRTARAKIMRDKQAHKLHKQSLIAGRHSLCWLWPEGAPSGRWLLLSYVDQKYRREPLGTADDTLDADGESVLTYEEARAKALAILDAPKAKRARMTVREAVKLYLDAKEGEDRPIKDTDQRLNAHVLPLLGDKVVAELTAEQLRKWRDDLAKAPAFKRSKKGAAPKLRPAPQTPEEKRKRRATVNRVLTMLKAALNHCFDEGHVANGDAWGRRLKPFEDADAARLRYLSIEESNRLVNASDADFRKLVRAALYTGARYGQLAELTVDRFDPRAGTVQLRTRKGRGKLKVFSCVLNDQGRAFFAEVCAGKSADALMFERADGIAWLKSEQKRPMEEACVRGNIKPRATFHTLRHTYASHSVMNGVPLIVVAKNLGHADTKMVEKHYGHLAPSFIADAIRKGAPEFDFEPGNVSTLSTAERAVA